MRSGLSLVLALAASLSTGVARADDLAPIRIGVTVTQSPPGSVIQGTQVLDALDVTAKFINDAGGINGRPIDFIVENTQGIPQRARDVVETLISREKVVAIVGEHQSANVLAAMDVAHRHGIPYINTNGWADAIREKGYREVFNPGNYNRRVAMAAVASIKNLGMRNVVSVVEDSDFGRGLAASIREQLAAELPTVAYRAEIVDRTTKQFDGVIKPLHDAPPDIVINGMLPPAAYTFINQMHAQGVGATSRTTIYDAAGVVDYPDFWVNVKEAATGMLVFGLYHPKMNLPPLAKEIGEAYAKRVGVPPGRLLFQAADSLLVLADALRRAPTMNGDDVIRALENTLMSGTRGEIAFASEPGYRHHQWVDVPYVTYQVTAVGQKVADMPLIDQSGRSFDVARLKRP